MIAPPFFILILSTHLEHDLIYSFQNVSAKSGSCAHFFFKCAKLAQSALSPTSSHNEVTVDIRTKVNMQFVIFHPAPCQSCESGARTFGQLDVL